MNNQPLFNRGFYYADAVFETLKISNAKICFLEDHYFRLMSSMRIMRMEIPANFNLDFFESILLQKTTLLGYKNARVKITVYRNAEGYYTPSNNQIAYIIDCKELQNQHYVYESRNCNIDIYKDFFISKNLLSNIKSTNKQIQVLAAIYAKENDYHNCVLLNTDKNLAEAINGNIFVLLHQELLTPPLTDGALNGIIRKQIINLKNIENIPVLEKSISSFDLQLADEVFVTNVISGVVSITKFRKKNYTQNNIAKSLVNELNKLIM